MDSQQTSLSEQMNNKNNNHNHKHNHNETLNTSQMGNKNDNEPSSLDISPATLEALKTLSHISSYSGVETITNSDKLHSSLEQIRSKKNMKLFNKLDKIRQDFSGLSIKLAQMEESISDLKQGTTNFIKSLPSSS